ncbi:fungal chitosanase of glycosyl hydrolase group 75-domain-containing protein [Mycena leptocephala]|nr:fungal chitosanase of glycosyl hydrolase group 75-domain-containing protein [Mycena leptocephala]
MRTALFTISASLLVCSTRSTSTATDPQPSSEAPSPDNSSTSAVAFAADASINVAAIYAAVQSATKIPLDAGSYPSSTDDGGKTVQIYGDWLTHGSGGQGGSNASTDGDMDSRAVKTSADSGGVAAFHFIADMDTDCDGPDMNCKGNTDGQSKTSFGALNAAEIPYFVLPETFTKAHTDILKQNALGAIICDGKMFYGIYGDQDGDDPEVIGEASVLMGKSCFPDTTVDGADGHHEVDVAYIVFGTQEMEVTDDKLDLAALKEAGDEQMKLLQAALGISEGTTSTAD